MPKKTKGGKKKKPSGDGTKRSLIYADIDGQVYGIIEKELGGRFFEVKCLDNVMRRCKVRKKRLKIKQYDVVIISLRDFDDKNADVIYCYDSDEVRILQKEGVIPTTDFVNVSFEETTAMDEDGGFEFEEI